ncbi:3-phosphoshikimate 1-carboxyvinyltransferase [Altibacter sp.]|uniref:3-phosphoshikimate 1-carboxyvinyltransferase n=1 Tax=Altibacter sp. TaxID=2024823 RepID=UPI000C8C2405|nr:3-phosphoshikimate 1-carboxyvinyltransferase [Altibacter sp.]MAP55921.1 3-phosphoshikimate 1-carboxyvinyltransferase [Altibacter sp.]
MTVLLQKTQFPAQSVSLTITGSKSESNRLLILKALFPDLKLTNLSNSDDTKVLQVALQQQSGTIDIHHAGTAMRFLAAYFASRDGVEVLLTGSERMQQRPIGILVDALRDLGADITYTLAEGFPPLRIKGSVLTSNSVKIHASVSSQYITSLLLIAPSLPNGLTLQLEGTVTSIPYIEMTLQLLKKMGVSCSFSENTIRVEAAAKITPVTFAVESDWSSASYFYSLVALSEGLSVTLKHFKENSLQGDRALVSLFETLGVITVFNASEASITLRKQKVTFPDSLLLHLSDTPDIAQTIAVTCFGLGVGCHLTGLHTLKIKETDRLSALKTELEKLGASVVITQDSLTLTSSEKIQEQVTIETYNDHRMAMAFAPLGLRTTIRIQDPKVVSKSFPGFWGDLEKCGISTDFQ